MLLQARKVSIVYLHTQVTLLVFMCLGWEINWKKCSPIPLQTITHLGFILNSVAMTISCPIDKVTRLQTLASSVLKSGHVTVNNLERLLGQMESVRPVTPHAALHYRAVQKLLNKAHSGGRNPKQIVPLSFKAIWELKWWVPLSGFASNCTSPIQEKSPTLNIWSDASLYQGGSHSRTGEYFQ